MMSVCGIIMVICPFIIPIMPSMAAGSDMGLGLGLPLASGSAKNFPSWYADTMNAFLAWNEVGDRTFALVRRLMPRTRARFCRICGSVCFFGAVWRRIMA